MPSSLRTIHDIVSSLPRGVQVSAFQRHYVWGQVVNGRKDAARYLTQCLKQAYVADVDYFLQGITLDADWVIDGQQRFTYIALLLRYLNSDLKLPIRYANRPEAEAFINGGDVDVSIDESESSQDVYFMKRTLVMFAQELGDLPHDAFLQYVLHRVTMLHITIPFAADATVIYKMMNGTKAPMLAPDIIKAEIMRLASDEAQPNMSERDFNTLRGRYANEWNTWVRWWHNPAVKEYFDIGNQHPLSLLLKLCLRPADSDCTQEVTFDELLAAISRDKVMPYHAAKHIFLNIRQTHKRFEQALADTTAYNRIRAILLLQRPQERYRFLHLYFVDAGIDAEELARYYRLSFLGMTVSEIYARESAAERFDDLLAALSQADVYHSDVKRDVFNLLLRLNIDEDIKLQRRFDFSVWNNRSLEHIYSKSRVWHADAAGNILDGNDNPLNITRHMAETDPTMLSRGMIVNHDGTQLSEHCIGNLVLLYGQNNAEFGNTDFEQKKMMFLTPGDLTVFRSRNLLHSVCVFAGRKWDHKSIVDNYNLTLKNLKLYYGYK